MSRLKGFVQLGAILGLLAAAAPVAWPDPQQCPLSSHDMGPLGPMGPWGAHGPLHDKPHAACVGGDPALR